MSRVIQAGLIIFLLLVFTTDLLAQARDGSGTVRIRIRTSEMDEPLVGYLTSPLEGSGPIRIIDSGGRLRSLERREIASIERYVRPNRVPWMIAGGLTGLATGVAIASAVIQDDYQWDSIFTDYVEDMGIATLAVVAGLGIGIAAGASLAPDRWRAIELSDDVAIQVTDRGSLVIRWGR